MLLFLRQYLFSYLDLNKFCLLNFIVEPRIVIHNQQIRSTDYNSIFARNRAFNKLDAINTLTAINCRLIMYRLHETRAVIIYRAHIIIIIIPIINYYYCYYRIERERSFLSFVNWVIKISTGTERKRK